MCMLLSTILFVNCTSAPKVDNYNTTLINQIKTSLLEQDFDRLDLLTNKFKSDSKDLVSYEIISNQGKSITYFPKEILIEYLENLKTMHYTIKNKCTNETTPASQEIHEKLLYCSDTLKVEDIDWKLIENNKFNHAKYELETENCINFKNIPECHPLGYISNSQTFRKLTSFIDAFFESTRSSLYSKISQNKIKFDNENLIKKKLENEAIELENNRVLQEKESEKLASLVKENKESINCKNLKYGYLQIYETANAYAYIKSGDFLSQKYQTRKVKTYFDLLPKLLLNINCLKNRDNVTLDEIKRKIWKKEKIGKNGEWALTGAMSELNIDYYSTNIDKIPERITSEKQDLERRKKAFRDSQIIANEPNANYSQMSGGTILGYSIKKKCEKLDVSLNESKKLIYKYFTNSGFDCQIFKDAVSCIVGNQFATTNYFKSRFLCEESYNASNFQSE